MMSSFSRNRTQTFVLPCVSASYCCTVGERLVCRKSVQKHRNTRTFDELFFDVLSVGRAGMGDEIESLGSRSVAGQQNGRAHTRDRDVALCQLPPYQRSPTDSLSTDVWTSTCLHHCEWLCACADVIN